MTNRSRLIAILGLACLGPAACTGGAAAATPKPAWAPIAATGPTVLPREESEVQRLTVKLESGNFTLTFNGQTTGNIVFDADAATVQAELRALSSIDGPNVSVKGGPGGLGGENTPYVIAFGGSLADSNQPAIGGELNGLPSEAVKITTFVEGGPGTSKMVSFIQNVGGADSSGTVTLTGILPDGVLLDGPASISFNSPWSCQNTSTKSFACTDTNSVPAGIVEIAPAHQLKVEPGAPEHPGFVHLTVSGGGADAPATFEMPLTISETPAGPGFQSFTAGAYDEEGHRDTRAGGHPFSASSGIMVNTVRSPAGVIVPAGELKDIKVSIPPGFLGNPTATPTPCPAATLETLNLLGAPENCPRDSIVGIDQPGVQFGEFLIQSESPVVNMEAPVGYPAGLRFKNLIEVINVNGKLRSDEDYGIDVESANTPQVLPVFFNFITLWGTPAASVYDGQRCAVDGCGPSTAPETAFLTNPTNCAEEAITQPLTTLTTNTWEHPDIFSHEDILLPPVTGCEKLRFAADFTFEPSETKSDSPASFRTSLTVPSEGLTTPDQLTTPEIRKSVVQLPKGVVLNASGADGLAACSEDQIGLKNEIDPATGLPIPLAMPNPLRFDKDPNSCPDASKIGTGELKTALLSDPLQGNLYLAAQGKGNPFGSLFAIYLVIEDPRHGIFIKLPGKVDPDEADGQMEVTFDNLPQLPFTKLDLTLKGGNRSALASPTTCGEYVTTAINTPWSAPESGPPTESSNGFEINQGPNGLPCAPTPQARPFDLGWKAGADNTQGGASGPFHLQITRPDGSQELESLQLGTPPGLTASLKGIPYCTEAEIKAAEASSGKAEQSNPACPAASQVGTTLTGSGSGPSPFYAKGHLYLAGPYKSAPLSVVAITPAVAGPFDLGDVVVRSAVHVDPESAQITAKTDPIPQILKGVVLRIRDVRIDLDRPGWTLNPTSCDPSSVNLSARGNSGAGANLSTRFQVGGCDKLAFKPKLALKLKGGTKRNDNPALTATLRYPEGPGYANVRSVAVTLPHSEFLDQSHIRTVCTRVQFAAKACPQGSIYGKATAITPLLDQPLTGPAYLRSSDNKLPDLVIALKGPPSQPIEVVLVGRIDSIKGGIRNSFELVPDAPVSKFTLEMQGGKKGLLVNSRNLCTGRPARATVRLIAQNNKRADQFPPLQNQCPKQHSKGSQQRGWLSKLVAGW